MKNKNYVSGDVAAQLKLKHDIQIHGQRIEILYGEGSKGDVGIKSKGKIDFLVNYCDYSQAYVKHFSK